MDLRKLQKLAVDALEDVKAKDIEVINTTKLTSLFDRIIVASGDSNRQVKALARSVHDKVKEAGGQVVGMEGEDSGEWVLVDLGDIVVHVMQPAVRVYYNIEELWTTKPKGRTAKAAAPDDDEADASPKAAPKTRTTTRTSAKTTAKPAAKTTVKAKAPAAEAPKRKRAPAAKKAKAV